MSSSAAQKLREYFERFPGIGARQARRFVYWLLSEDVSFVKNLSELLLELKKDAKQCGECFRFYSSIDCSLCRDLNRDNSKIMVVEKDVDLENIEKTGVYAGRYFVLGGVIPLGQLDKKAEKNVRLKELYNRIEQSAKNGLKEIIFALSATIEGDNTTRYLEKILEPLTKKNQLKITRFGRGLSTGTELEYIDADTLKNALENRK